MSIERQAEEVRRVKKHESGVVTDPQTVLPTTTLHEVKALTERNGFAGYPVVTEDNELVGIITGRDVRFVTDLNQPVSVYMTPKERLVTVREGEAREVVLAKMHEKRVEKALVVDDNFHLLGMITVKDFRKRNVNQTPVKMSRAVYVSARRSAQARATKSALTRWWRQALTFC